MLGKVLALIKTDDAQKTADTPNVTVQGSVGIKVAGNGM